MAAMHGPASAIESFSTNERWGPRLSPDGCLARSTAPEAYRHVDNAIQHVDKANALTTWGGSILAGAFSASLASKAVPLRGTENVSQITALYDTLC